MAGMYAIRAGVSQRSVEAVVENTCWGGQPGPEAAGAFVADDRSRTRRPTSSDLKIVVDEEAAIVVCFQPVVQMNLVQIRSDDLLAQFVGFRTQERDVQPGEDSDQGLQNAIRVNVGMSIRRFHLAKRG